jgi:phosphoribosylglycinamide formyltransferase 1
VSVRLAVFASGGGSNLQALLDRFAGASHVDIALVVSDRGDSGVLRRARAAGVTAAHIAVRDRTEAGIAHDMLETLADARIDLIALAGYLRLVPPVVVETYRGRMLNVHPSLLPAFGGPGMYGSRVHEAVLAAGCCITGATVHHVDERYDEGRIIAQWPVPVLPGDSAATLAARVLTIEHRIYPAVIDAIARGVKRENGIAGETFTIGGADVPTDRNIVAIARI